jgi:hypothetical protein
MSVSMRPYSVTLLCACAAARRFGRTESLADLPRPLRVSQERPVADRVLGGERGQRSAALNERPQDQAFVKTYLKGCNAENGS